MVKIVKHDIPALEQINGPSGRHYKTIYDNTYPSVTTIIGFFDREWVENWKTSIGPEVAEKISKAAAARGTRLHSCCEEHLLGKTPQFTIFEHGIREMYKNIVPELEKLDEVHAIEQRLWSDKLKVAGTVDCIAIIDGVWYIIDFKTSTNMRNRSDIPGYFMQCAAYAMAWYERTGITVTRMRVIISTQDDGVFVYDEAVKDWLGKFVEVRQRYEESVSL